MHYRRGQLSLELLLLSGIVVILVSGLVVWASGLLQFSSRDYNKTLAFSIAEAGIEYYRWHLAHSAQDFWDGNSSSTPGPYVHDYKNEAGNVVGSFALNITPPDVGSTVVKIRSTGRVNADPTVEKIIEVRLQFPTLINFAVVVNGNVRIGTGTEVFGPIMANGGVHFDGIAHNTVQSALTTYNDPDINKTEWAVWTANPPADPQPPTPYGPQPDVFLAGRAIGVPAIDFPGITQNLATIKSLAQASGTYYGPSGAFGYDLALATSGLYSLYRVTALAPGPNSCTNTSNEPGWGIWSIQNETLYATGTIPSGGVIFTEDDLWVRGQVDHKRVTIAAGRFPDNPDTRANITVNNSTRYTNYDGIDVIAMIAQNDFNVGLYSEDILRIDGVLVAQNGRVKRPYYAPPNLQSNSEKCGPTVIRQRITLYGSIISNILYGLGFEDSAGYQERIIIYDSNLLYNSPPAFPKLGDQYTLVSWDEVK